jgi:hydroxypyruvate reductase
MEPARFLTTSLREHPSGAAIVRVLAAALDAVDPYRAVRRSLIRENDLLRAGETEYDLRKFQRVLLVGAGKAAYPMALAALDLLGDHIYTGVLITKDGHAPGLELPCGVHIREAGHPIPDQRGLAAALEMQSLLESAGPHDLVLCLISGGGSALMPAPASQLSLSDLQNTTSALLACGADIQEINTLRKHLDRLKGGRFARLAAPATLLALVLSDVIGDPLEIIASGPTVPDPSTYADALGTIQHFALEEKIPSVVIRHLDAGRKGEIDETPKPGDILFERVHTLLVGSNIQAAHAALEQACGEGWHTLLLTTSLQGEARQAGRFLAALARQIHVSGDPIPRPACLVAGGETTVTLAGSGRGGRNQELALGALRDLAGLPNTFLVALATDGSDGPTDASGAVVTGFSLSRALHLGLDPDRMLARNDAYNFFAPLGDLLLPGPTQTNVNDLSFIFVL